MEYCLTSGKIGRSLIVFSLPMILGNLLQQLYNVADTLIVGKTIGATALSAVGSSAGNFVYPNIFADYICRYDLCICL